MAHERYLRFDWARDIWDSLPNNYKEGSWNDDKDVQAVFDVLKRAGIGDQRFIEGKAGHPKFGSPDTNPDWHSTPTNEAPGPSVADLAKLYDERGDIKAGHVQKTLPESDQVLQEASEQQTGWHTDIEVEQYEGRGMVVGEVEGQIELDLHGWTHTWAGAAQATYDQDQALIDQAGRKTYDELETAYIDKLYGTTNRMLDEGKTFADAQEYLQSQIDEGVINDTWGLDIVRLPYAGEKGTPEHYEQQYSGDINWAFYRTDTTFTKAWAEHLDGEGVELDEFDGITSVAEIRAINPKVWEDAFEKSQGTHWNEGVLSVAPPRSSIPKYTASEMDIVIPDTDEYTKDEVVGPDREPVSPKVAAPTFWKNVSSPLSIKNPSNLEGLGKPPTHGADPNVDVKTGHGWIDKTLTATET